MIGNFRSCHEKIIHDFNHCGGGLKAVPNTDDKKLCFVQEEGVGTADNQCVVLVSVAYCCYATGLSFISNRQRRKEVTFFVCFGIGGDCIEPTPPAPEEQGIPLPTWAILLFNSSSFIVNDWADHCAAGPAGNFQSKVLFETKESEEREKPPACIQGFQASKSSSILLVSFYLANRQIITQCISLDAVWRTYCERRLEVQRS